MFFQMGFQKFLKNSMKLRQNTEEQAIFFFFFLKKLVFFLCLGQIMECDYDFSILGSIHFSGILSHLIRIFISL